MQQIIPPQCADCKKTGAALNDCRIRVYTFHAIRKENCPRENGGAKQTATALPTTTFKVVPINGLLSSSFSSRLDPEDPEIAELTESIKLHGVIEPILIRQKPSGAFEVVAGARRLRAAKKAGLPTIPVIIKTLTDEEAFILQLTENLQRKDLTEEEKTRGLKELARRTKWSPQQIADKLKMSYTWVMKYLPDEFKEKNLDPRAI